MLAFACSRVPRAHHLARRATQLFSIFDRSPPLLSFSFFVGGSPLRPGVRRTNPHPGLSINLAHTFPLFSFFEPVFHSRTPVSSWLDFSNGTRLSPTRRLALPFEIVCRAPHPHITLPAEIRAIHTPLARTRTGSLPSSRPHPPVSSTFFSQVHSVLCCLGIHPLAAITTTWRGSNDEGTDGRGAVGTFRYT